MNLLDTAANYPGSEEAIGKAIQGKRDEFVLVSKCGPEQEGLEGESWSADLIRKTIDRSLERLQTDHLDVVLLHTCGQRVLEEGEALGALVKAREAGKVRFCGYSGDNEAAAYAATLEDVAVIETSISIADQRNIDTVLPVCRDHDIGVLAKRPLANACWKPITSQRGIYSDYAKPYTQRFAAMNITPFDLGYSGHPEIEWPEIALKFTLAQPGVHCAIAGTTSATNAAANVAAVQKNPLREQVVQRLRTAFRDAEKTSGDTWQGLT